MKLKIGDKVEYTGKVKRRLGAIGEVARIEEDVYGIKWPNERLIQWYPPNAYHAIKQIIERK